ncbi:MAG: hypothetical protein U9N59_08705 [Campylobacterota bacterium]|nr:hypothetical protein [Campylobacterota bacterium]
MILVLNEKPGVGCTTLAYNLSRLLDKPLYVNNDSFLLKDERFYNISPKIQKITSSKTDGIFDVGSQVERPLVKKFIQNAELITVPMELGYESIVKTAETIRYIKFVKPNVPIIVILNRLSSEDSDREFNYKFEAINRLNELDVELHKDTIDFPGDDKVILTYLRNSYLLFEGYEDGEYFLDKYKRSNYDDVKNTKRDKKDFDFRFLKYLASIEFNKTDYQDDEIYRQDKDMVMFRNDFKNKYEDSTFNGFAYDKTTLEHNRKLIKDMAYILYAIKYTIGWYYIDD